MREDLKRFIRRKDAPIANRIELPSFDELARIYLAFANSGGGSLVVGVDENGQVTGLADYQSMTDRSIDILRLIQPLLRVELLGTEIEQKKVMIAEVLPERRVSYHMDGAVNVLRTFRRDGQFWTASYDGITKHLKDTKGVRYIAHLLAHPKKEFQAIELVHAVGGVGQARANAQEIDSEGLGESPLENAFDPLLDPQAIGEYRSRKEYLESELADAEKNHDLSRQEKLSDEIAALTEQLIAASGLGGRVRSFAGSQEKARKTVQAAISTAMKTIQEEHPLLHQHLAASVHTGRLCSYTPVPPVTWSL